MNNFCTFYIVRHGESESNAKWKSDEPYRITKTIGEFGSKLTQKGIEQAEDRSKELKDIHFDVAFSSDFVRAQHTAEIILKERELALLTTKLLRERFWGTLDGRLGNDIKKETEELKKGLSDEEKMNVKIVEDAESEEEGASRLITFLRETAIAYPGKTILVVAHGNIMRMFLIKLGWATYDELGMGKIVNTGYFVLKSDGVEFEVVKTVGVNKASF